MSQVRILSPRPFLFSRNERKADLKIPFEIDDALAREARLAHRPKVALLKRAVKLFLEGLADARKVRAVRRRAGQPIPWTEIKRRHGLAG